MEDPLELAVITAGGGDVATSDTFEVINPATGRLLAEAPSLSLDALDAVFAAADRAYDTWRLDDAARRERLAAAADVIEAAAERLAPLLTAEQGKPLKDARDEIRQSAIWLRYYADLDLEPEVIRDDASGFEQVNRRPLGVVAAIAPWNYPVLLATWKIAPALRAGNTIVVKPSPYTPLTTLAVGRLLRDVLPEGVLNVIAGVEPLGAMMVTNPLTRKVSFTGSTDVGRRVAVSAADQLKRVTLELGGNDPAIVLADADVATTARRLFAAGFRNNGQTCFAVKRIYAHAAIHDELVEVLAQLAHSANVGDGLADGVELGPINNDAQRRHVDDLVRDAVSRGGRSVTGGSALDRDGYFYAPTIVDRVQDGIRIVDEEQFGPVLPVITYRDPAKVVANANRSHYGLTASVWSADLDRAAALAGEIDCGQVSVNRHGSGVQPYLPFGGHKWSGIGVENGIWGLNGYTELQVISAPLRRLVPLRDGSSR